ncbi:MAG: DUF4079 domain-containing protein [Oscillatoriales cyanobacterium]|nr:MAG: DUF4079 domain-containing protein [Oscillatoriales cyanobacterium]
MVNVSELLEPIASQFRSLGIPEPITHWGHPVMMGIVVVAMGSFVGYTGWQGRLAADKDVALKSRSDHRKLAPWMFLFLALGYTGGLLSLVMQHKPVMESPHFWTGSGVLVLLAAGSLMVHAYLGTTALALMVLHAAFGLKLGLSI